MNDVFDALIAAAETRLRNGVAQADAELRRAIAAQFMQATWRLNEAEAALQWKAIIENGSWQPFFYPYGSRRKATEGMDVEAYMMALPKEHQGDKSRMIELRYN